MAGSAALLNPAELVNFIEALKVEVPAAMPFIKGTVAFPFIYHYLSGLRHLVRPLCTCLYL
jgi:succinate dehydrogenase/fumarate reductase cytochrome b subunit